MHHHTLIVLRYDIVIENQMLKLDYLQGRGRRYNSKTFICFKFRAPIE